MKRNAFFLTAAVLMLGGAVFVASCNRHVDDHPDAGNHAPAPGIHCTAPAFLSPGDKIALISPSYNTPYANIAGAAAVLREWGFKPVVGKHVNEVYLGKYAGTPSERLSDLTRALRDPSIKAILCNRGGYGTIQMVNAIDSAEFAAHPKWLIGFSDITTLHGMETRAGVMSIHGTMSSLIVPYEGKNLSSTLIRDLLLGTVPEYAIPAHPQDRPGRAAGTLVGGNLCTFTPVLGTWADATAADDIILFIEEVEENMSHIDRLFNMLILNGVLDRCKGIVLGEFTDCEADLGFGSIEEMLCSYLKDYDIPVCCGFPAGHGEVNLPLVMGARVTLDVTAEGTTLAFNLPGNTQRIDTAEAEQAARADSLRKQEPLLPSEDIRGDKQNMLMRGVQFLRHYNGVLR